MPRHSFATIVLGASSLLPTGALAQECELAPIHQHGVLANDSAVHGGFAYIVGSGLQIMDLSGEGAPVQSGFIPIARPAHVSVSGDTLWVTADDGNVTLHAFDLSTPGAPVLISTTDLGDLQPFLSDLDVRAGLALVNASQSLVVIDVSDPAAPAVLSSFSLDGVSVVRDSVLTRSGALLYSPGAPIGRLDSIDLANPAAPAHLATIAAPDIYDLAAHADGDVVYASSFPNLQVIDVSNPAQPQFLASLPTPLVTDELALDGDLLVSANSGSGVLTIDVSDPATPHVLSNCCTFVEPSQPYAIPLVAHGGGRALVHASSRALLLDITDPASPMQLGTRPFVAAVRGADMTNDLLVTVEPSRITIMAVDPSGTFLPISSIPDNPGLWSAAPSESVSVSGDRAAIVRRSSSSSQHHANLLDLSDPLQPAIVASTPVTTSVGLLRYRVLWIGDALYVISTSFPPTAVDILDAAAPGMPRVASFIGDKAYRTENGVVFGLGSDGRITAYDPADPFNLTPLSSTPPIPSVAGSSTWANLAVESGLAYLRNLGEIAIVDVSNPAAMQHITTFATTPAPFAHIVVQDAIVYVSEHIAADPGAGKPESSAIIAIDASHPLRPATLLRHAVPYSTAFAGFDHAPQGLLLFDNQLSLLSFATCPCPGDTNGDNLVDMADLMTMLDAFNTTPADAHYNPAADVDHDDDVDFADLNVVVSAFNTAC